MKKSHQLIILVALIGTMGLVYNNCSQVKFVTNSGVSDAAAPNTTSGTLTPPTGQTTFNNTNEPATIAYNDNYPGAGDSDYNDFVVNINVTEEYATDGQLNKITVVYSPKYKISGIDHSFVLGFDGKIRGRSKGVVSNLANVTTLPMFEGSANIDYELVDSTGAVLNHEANHDKSTDLVVFPSTTKAMTGKEVATITVTNIDGSQNLYATRGTATIKRYRSVLNNNQYDIDISDINPKFVDQGGAAVGFFVPVNWRPPKETQSIFPAYPQFKAHSAYILSGADLASEPTTTSEWFNDLADPSLVLP